MKRKQVNAILTNQTKRRNTVLAFVCAIIVVFVVAVSFFFIYYERSKGQYVSYDETSSIDYKVFLKDNDFFEGDYLGTENQYIASLIENITADFKYNLSLDSRDVEYKYSYRIEANVDVKQKGTDYSLYNKTEELLGEVLETTSSDEVIISESVDIDYNYYNALISKFIDMYKLDDTISTLTINMYVNVVGSCEDFVSNKAQESVVSLSIPLTTKTMAIDISDDLINTENNLMQCKSSSYSFIFLVFGILCVVIDLGLIVYIIRYEIKTRTAENIYERELKKILNNYGTYIQEISDEFNLKGYQAIKINTFEDMLEIRDTIRQPILLKENEDKTGAYFVIPSNTKLLYIYRLKVSDIEIEMEKKKQEIEF